MRLLATRMRYGIQRPIDVTILALLVLGEDHRIIPRVRVPRILFGMVVAVYLQVARRVSVGMLQARLALRSLFPVALLGRLGIVLFVNLTHRPVQQISPGTDHLALQSYLTVQPVQHGMGLLVQPMRRFAQAVKFGMAQLVFLRLAHLQVHRIFLCVPAQLGQFGMETSAQCRYARRIQHGMDIFV